LSPISSPAVLHDGEPLPRIIEYEFYQQFTIRLLWFYLGIMEHLLRVSILERKGTPSEIRGGNVVKKKIVSMLLALVMVVCLGAVASAATTKAAPKTAAKTTTKAKAKTPAKTTAKTAAKTPAKPAAKPAPVKPLSGTLTIAGSTSVQPFSEVLAEQFMKLHPQVRVNVQGGGSSQGVTASIQEICDIGSSSRDLTADEKKVGLVEYEIARDGIAIIVHPSNKVNDLSIAQIHDIFSGKVTNWKQVGGPDAKITLVTREAGSGTRDGFEKMVMGSDKISAKALVSNSTGAVETTVAGDPSAVGYISMAAVDKTVKAVTVEGVKANNDNVSNRTYKMQRPFIYITKFKPEGLAKAFIDFTLSDQGQSIIDKEGAVRVK
jgi:phosphate transport system substrate-binding protein